MALFTPTTFFAPKVESGGLPNVITGSYFWIDANETTGFQNQSDRGALGDGVEQVVGGGTSATITHTTVGSYKYWDFVATSPGTQQRYVDFPNSTIGNAPSWSYVGVVSTTDDNSNATFLWSLDSGTDNLIIFTDRSSDKIFSRASNGSRRDLLSQQIYQSVFYFLVISYDAASGLYALYLNNVLDVSSTVNAAVNLTDIPNIGFPGTSATTTNNQGIGVTGFWNDYALTANDRTALFDYYDALYNF